MFINKSSVSMSKYQWLWLIAFLLLGSSFLPASEWGFFGHRRINRLAVFTLPPEMIPFYKKHIEYITEHAVDPDKRRYATRHEAVRHYIDIDHWGEFPFPNVPREWSEAIMTYAEMRVINGNGDTLIAAHPEVMDYSGQVVRYVGNDPELAAWWAQTSLPVNEYLTWFRKHVMPQYYEEDWVATPSALSELMGRETDCREVRFIDHFSEYGVLPYNLLRVQNNLTEAFRSGNEAAILRLSAELGHYIGDAHVPLHTTENYNGELTNQRGIHAFWESRIPELFADEEFDPLVGRAEYIAEPADWYWDIVLTSHQLVDSVLRVEKQLSQEFPVDRQYCFEERLGRTVRVECTEYARAYQQRMRGMVEERWRASIHAIGCAWYTAWVDAGQPDLSLLGTGLTPSESDYFRQLEEAFRAGEAQGRKH
jgi:hypothetical protein